MYSRSVVGRQGQNATASGHQIAPTLGYLPTLHPHIVYHTSHPYRPYPHIPPTPLSLHITPLLPSPPSPSLDQDEHSPPSIPPPHLDRQEEHLTYFIPPPHLDHQEEHPLHPHLLHPTPHLDHQEEHLTYSILPLTVIIKRNTLSTLTYFIPSPHLDHQEEQHLHLTYASSLDWEGHPLFPTCGSAQRSAGMGTRRPCYRPRPHQTIAPAGSGGTRETAPASETSQE